MDRSEEEIEFIHSSEFAKILKPRNEKSFDDEEHNPSTDVPYELGCTYYRDGSDKIMKDGLRRRLCSISVLPQSEGIFQRGVNLHCMNVRKTCC